MYAYLKVYGYLVGKSTHLRPERNVRARAQFTLVNGGDFDVSYLGF